MNRAHGTAQAKAGVARPPRARAYGVAQRHSVRVRLLKRAIPVGAAVAIAIVLGIAIFDPFGRMSGISLGPVSLSGTKITMEHPRLTGYRKDTRPYEVTATAAFQDVRKPNVIELQDMTGRLAMDDNGTIAHLRAATGVYDTQKEYLELKTDIRVSTDNGQEALLKSATVDFKAGTVVSREPVTVKFSGGTIAADALDVSDSGKIIVFTGHVQTILDSAGSDGRPRVAQNPPSSPDMPTVIPVAETSPAASADPAATTSTRP